MDEAKRRINECIRTGSTSLDLSRLGLTSLPELPDTLTHLDCSYNQLTILPELPDTLTILECIYNQLTELPELPDTLTHLNCYNNQLTVLLWSQSDSVSSKPELPDTLTHLYCRNNQLTVLPLKLLRNDCICYCFILLKIRTIYVKQSYFSFYNYHTFL